MKKIAIVALVTLAMACGESRKETAGALGEKKAELAQLEKQQKDLNAKVEKLRGEIEKLDTGAARSQKAKLVTIAPVASQNFEHFIELQGTVKSENVVNVTPRGGGGQVKSIHVTQGQSVRKGQLILTVDDAIMRQNLAASRQRLQELNTQIAFAKDLANRQQNLWNQGIGTEVQLITARNNVKALENQLASANEGIKVSQEQLATARVVAPISGVVDQVNVRVGEFFTGNPMAGISIVNNGDLKVTAQVPETYIDKVAGGTRALVNLPDIGRVLEGRVNVSGKIIDPLSRSFYVDIDIPADGSLKPNQIANVKIQDYSAPNSVVIPLATLQSDEKGKFVMVAVKEGDKLVARKRPVAEGMLSGDNLEIKIGLQAGEMLITEGYQNLYDGQLVTTSL